MMPLPPPPLPPPPPPPPPTEQLDRVPGGVAPEPESSGGSRLAPLDAEKLRAVGLEGNEALAFATDEEIYGAALGAVGTGRVLREREALQARLFSERWQGEPASAAGDQQDGCATFGCGSDIYGRLGRGTYEEHSDRFVPVDAFAGARLQAIESGAAHVIALTAEGKVYTWGKAHMHQVSFSTGTEAGCNDAAPDALAGTIARRVRAMESWGWPLAVESALATEQVQTIAAGWHHCLAVTRSGVVYGWGSLRGLGIGPPVSAGDFRRASPVAVEIEGLVAPVAAVAAGGCGNAGGHSIVCDAEGKVFCWGDNSYGQLGLGSTEATVWRPRLCEAVGGTPVANAACGGCHSLLLMQDGGVQATGDNSRGQLGVETNTRPSIPAVRTPTEVPLAAATAVLAGATSSGAVVGGRLVLWGALLSGVFAASSPTAVPVPFATAASHIVSAALGERHCIVADSVGQIYVWGTAASPHYELTGRPGSTGIERSALDMLSLGVEVQPAATLPSDLAAELAHNTIVCAGTNASYFHTTRRKA